jgi:sensor histidine kinase YesM
MIKTPEQSKALSVRSLLFQLGFWTLSYFVILRIFTREYDNGTVDVIYTFLFHIPLVILVYLNLFLAKLLLNKSRYFLYGISAVALLPLGILLNYFVFNILGEIFFEGYYFISMLTDWDLCQYFLVYIIVSLLLFLSKNWFELRERQAILETENKAIQLESLRAQLNPHFLFNSLNNIYSLISPSDVKGRDYLIKLSDTLRYMLYETGKEKLSLTEDLRYLKNYIELECLRLEEDAEIDISLDIDAKDYKIAPLLFLPIVENVFKHQDKTKSRITIQLEMEESTIILRTKNTFNKERNEKNSGGIGISNTKKRLALIYPQQHSYSYGQTDNFYHSEIKIKLVR